MDLYSIKIDFNNKMAQIWHNLKIKSKLKKSKYYKRATNSDSFMERETRLELATPSLAT